VTPVHARTAPRTFTSSAPSADGTRLPEATEERASRFLQYNFAQVRVHADHSGETVTGGLEARAATIGQDIFFAPGEYQPGTTEGERLIGHELAHVIQQEGGEPARGGPADTQRAADSAGEAVARGQSSRIGQPAASTGRPARQPKPQSTDAGAHAQAAPTNAPAAAPTKSWDQRVTDAQAESDIAKKSAAMTALAQEALGAAYTVTEAGTTSIDKLDRADYAQAPTINFDVRLTTKKKTNGNPVGDVAGHTFGRGPSAQYSILGPKALKSGSRQDVVLYADHELYHSKKPSAGELEVWTDSFLNYFLKSIGNQWAPLIGYYDTEKADGTGKFPRREATMTALDTYYKGLSDTAPPGVKNSDKTTFILWFRRRLSDRPTSAFVMDLSKKTGVTATASAATAPTSPVKP
jgi:hypothetical protein